MICYDSATIRITQWWLQLMCAPMLPTLFLPLKHSDMGNVGVWGPFSTMQIFAHWGIGGHLPLAAKEVFLHLGRLLWAMNKVARWWGPTHQCFKPQCPMLKCKKITMPRLDVYHAPMLKSKELTMSNDTCAHHQYKNSRRNTFFPEIFGSGCC